MANGNASTVTDVNGVYVMHGLLPGNESVRFSNPGHIETTRSVTLAEPVTTLDVQLSAAKP